MTKNGAKGPQPVIKYKTTWSLLNWRYYLHITRPLLLPGSVKQIKPITSHPQPVIKYKTTWSLLNWRYYLHITRPLLLPGSVKQIKPITSRERNKEIPN